MSEQKCEAPPIVSSIIYPNKLKETTEYWNRQGYNLVAISKISAKSSSNPVIVAEFEKGVE